jgi:hypothetical protein
MSILNRAAARLLVLFVLVAGVATLWKPAAARALTCHSECANGLRSCDLACQFDPSCETACDADYQACLACCDTGC